MGLPIEEIERERWKEFLREAEQYRLAASLRVNHVSVWKRVSAALSRFFALQRRNGRDKRAHDEKWREEYRRRTL